MTWEKINIASDKHDFKVDKEIEGKYVEREDGKKEGEFVYIIELSDGTKKKVYSTRILNQLFEEIEIGQFVKIVLTGERKSGEGNTYYLFDVYTKSEEITTEEVEIQAVE